MAILNPNIGGSVVKREAKSFSEVTNQLQRDGWERTAEMGNRMVHFEKTGVSITVIDGLAATLIFPSGPLRGMAVSHNVGFVGMDSVVGLGQKSKNDTKKQMKDPRKADNELL